MRLVNASQVLWFNLNGIEIKLWKALLKATCFLHWTIIGGKLPKKCCMTYLGDFALRFLIDSLSPTMKWLSPLITCIFSSPTTSNTLQCSPLQVDMKIATCPAPRNSVGGTKCSSQGFVYDSDKIEIHQCMVATLQCNTIMLTTLHLNNSSSRPLRWWPFPLVEERVATSTSGWGAVV